MATKQFWVYLTLKSVFSIQKILKALLRTS